MFETQIIDSWIFCYDPRLTKVKTSSTSIAPIP